MTGRDLERGLFLASRDLGDVRAARRGSKPLARRLVRRQVRRSLIGPMSDAIWRLLWR